jgi:hypothetical protein
MLENTLENTFETTLERKKRRPIILKGISQDLNHSEISAQLGAHRGVLMRDIKLMRYNGDLGLRQAERAQVQAHEKKVLLLTMEKTHFKQNERFRGMTGISLQEKSFRNMIDFNRHELLKILKSKDQHAAIIKLSKSIQKTLKKNGIIVKRWQDNEISERAEEYLTIKNPAREP